MLHYLTFSVIEASEICRVYYDRTIAPGKAQRRHYDDRQLLIMWSQRVENSVTTGPSDFSYLGYRVRISNFVISPFLERNSVKQHNLLLIAGFTELAKTTTISQIKFARLAAFLVDLLIILYDILTDIIPTVTFSFSRSYAWQGMRSLALRKLLWLLMTWRANGNSINMIIKWLLAFDNILQNNRRNGSQSDVKTLVRLVSSILLLGPAALSRSTTIICDMKRAPNLHSLLL